MTDSHAKRVGVKEAVRSCEKLAFRNVDFYVNEKSRISIDGTFVNIKVFFGKLRAKETSTQVIKKNNF